MGTEVSEFESDFAKKFGSDFSVMFNSGSSANLGLLAGLKYMKNSKLNDGDEILVPAVSWSTTYYPIHQLNMKLSFVDIDLDTLNIDTNRIEDAITPKTKAIFAVNLLGNPCDFEKLYTIADKYNLLLIEDNCESMGAKYKEKFTGSHQRWQSYLGLTPRKLMMPLSNLEQGLHCLKQWWQKLTGIEIQ
jgi:CDP-6-deoxy-D-xylo-4-hexulose-3-dehydrase